MINKNKLLGLLFIFIVFLLFYGYSLNNKNEKRVKIGYFKSVSSIPFIVGHEKGFFKDKGIETELVYFGDKIRKIFSSVESGRLDCSLRSKVSLFSAIKEGSKTCMLDEIYSKGNKTGVLGLYVPQSSRCLSDHSCNFDLGYRKGGIEEIVALNMIDKGKISWENVNHINARGSSKALFLKSGDIDGALLMPDQYVLIDKKLSLIKVADSIEVLPNSIFGAIYCSNKFSRNFEKIEEFKRGIGEYKKFINDNAKKVKRILAEKGYYGEEIMNIDFPVYSTTIGVNKSKQKRIVNNHSKLNISRVETCPLS